MVRSTAPVGDIGVFRKIRESENLDLLSENQNGDIKGSRDGELDLGREGKKKTKEKLFYYALEENL